MKTLFRLNLFVNFNTGTVYNKLPDEFMDRVIAESQKLTAQVWRETMSGMLAADSKSELGKIKAPTLILWGEKESIFGRQEQEELIAAIPHAVFKVYANTGHNPNWEKPEQFIKDFEEFLNINRNGDD